MSDYARGKFVQAGGWFVCAALCAVVAVAGMPSPADWLTCGAGFVVGIAGELVGWRIIRRGKP